MQQRKTNYPCLVSSEKSTNMQMNPETGQLPEENIKKIS